jgi:hypothetical protein
LLKKEFDFILLKFWDFLGLTLKGIGAMSSTFKIYPEKQLIVTRFTGLIVYDDMLHWIDEVLQHESFSREYDGIVDLREAAFKTIRADKAKLLGSDMIERNFTKGKWAILVSTPIETALSLLYNQVATQQHPIESFSTVEAAASFLGKDLKGVGLEQANCL